MASPSALSLLVMRAFYGVSALGAGRQGLQLLLDDERAVQEAWGGSVSPPLAASVLGSMWTAASLLSVAGLLAPVTFSPVLLFQFVYKVAFQLKSVVPQLLGKKPADRATRSMGTIFAPYVLVLPFFLPWGHLLGDLRPAF